MNDIHQKINSAAWIGCCILLVSILLKINMTQRDLAKTPRGSGQTVQSGPVMTERYYSETLESWGERHRSALREFKEEEK